MLMEIKFKRDTSFRKQFFVPDSFAHPAKMDAQLLIWIVERYTDPGETILDPMAGSGTMMLACTLGRNVVLVELEQKFCKMMVDNWEKVRMRPQLGSQMGNCQIIQGDARQLVSDCSYCHGAGRAFPDFFFDDKGRKHKLPISKDGKYEDCPKCGGRGFEGLVDSVIFSPPYAESKELHDTDFMINTAGDITKRLKDGKIKGHACSKEARERIFQKRQGGLPENEDNIGSLPYGQIDKIVTSPPYEEAMGKKHHSPVADRIAREKHLGQSYTGRVDSIITSPPYEGSVSASTGGERDQSSARRREKRLKDKGFDPAKYQGGVGRNLEVDFQYSKADDNIGNLKSDSYLEAMLQVYQSCFSVLRAGGLMVLVTKNFIRNKQIIRLDTDTIKLCEQVGFTYVERHYRKLPSQSFWRIIYHQKHPEVEQILNEDVLVFKKL